MIAAFYKVFITFLFASQGKQQDIFTRICDLGWIAFYGRTTDFKQRQEAEMESSAMSITAG